MKSNGNWWGWTGRNTATEHSACCEPKITRRHYGEAFRNPGTRWEIIHASFGWAVYPPKSILCIPFDTFSEAVAYVREALS